MLPSFVVIGANKGASNGSRENYRFGLSFCLTQLIRRTEYFHTSRVTSNNAHVLQVVSEHFSTTRFYTKTSQRQSAGKHARWLFALALMRCPPACQRHRIFREPPSHKPGAISPQTLSRGRVLCSSVDFAKYNPALTQGTAHYRRFFPFEKRLSGSTGSLVRSGSGPRELPATSEADRCKTRTGDLRRGIDDVLLQAQCRATVCGRFYCCPRLKLGLAFPKQHREAAARGGPRAAPAQPD